MNGKQSRRQTIAKNSLMNVNSGLSSPPTGSGGGGVGLAPMKPLKAQNDKSRQRLLGASAKAINYERPMDPTDTNDAVELQRLRATKWLPALADNARVINTTTRRGASTLEISPARVKEESLKRLLNQASLPNIPLNKGRFPASELRKCHETRTHLKNNPNRRFLIGLRERALEIDEKNAKRAIVLQKAQEASGALSWDLLRPLSRDPIFGKYIQALNEFGHELGFTSESDLKKLSAPSSDTTSTPDTPSKSIKSQAKKNIAKSNIAGTKCSVGDEDLDKLITAIETSVFRAKRKGDCAIRGNLLQSDKPEIGYEFGKPSVLKDGEAEEYAESFRQLVNFGEEVGESILQSQKDKANFTNINPPRGAKGRNFMRLSPKQQIDSDMSQVLGFSKPPTAKETRKDPSKLHRQDFLKWQTNGQIELKKALKARLLDRLEASKDNERLRKVMNIIEEDIKVDFYLHSASDPKHWMSVLPHIWVKDSDSLMKDLENPLLKQLNARRNVNGGAPVVTAASFFKERAMITALVNTHAKETSLAGHQRRDSIIAAARRLDEYQKMIEGKDIVAERSTTADLFSDSHLEVLFGKKQNQIAVPAPLMRRSSMVATLPNPPACVVPAPVIPQRQNSIRQGSIRQNSLGQNSIKGAVRFHESHMAEAVV